MTIGMIWAESPERIIGVGGIIPWRHAGDLKRFKRVTMGSTIVMGRKTWESIGKPLPGRTNIVVTSGLLRGEIGWPLYAVTTPRGALEHWIRAGAKTDLWFIGGAQVYAAAMPFAELLDVTYVPDRFRVVAPRTVHTPDMSVRTVLESEVVYAPTIDETLWEAGPILDHEDAPGLKRREFRRRAR